METIQEQQSQEKHNHNHNHDHDHDHGKMPVVLYFVGLALAVGTKCFVLNRYNQCRVSRYSS